MIGYWHHPVRLSVCPSVCDTVHCVCQGWCTRLKVEKCVPSRHVPLCPFRHCWCNMYRLATKCTTKKLVAETHVCISLYRLLTVEPRDLILSPLITLHARACTSREVSWPTYVPSLVLTAIAELLVHMWKVNRMMPFWDDCKWTLPVRLSNS